jgi:hypothetical protein
MFVRMMPRTWESKRHDRSLRFAVFEQGESPMRLTDVRKWNHCAWTQLYEAALFERDPVKLCALIWNAQLAILRREQEIQHLSPAQEKETLALKKALSVLRELGRLSGLDVPMETTIGFARARSSHTTELDSRVRSNRRGQRNLAA